MITLAFHFKLRKLKGRGKASTMGRIVNSMFIGRARLNHVFNNKLQHGGKAQVKIIPFFKKKYNRKQVERLLMSLHWNKRWRCQCRPSST